MVHPVDHESPRKESTARGPGILPFKCSRGCWFFLCFLVPRLYYRRYLSSISTWTSSLLLYTLTMSTFAEFSCTGSSIFLLSTFLEKRVNEFHQETSNLTAVATKHGLLACLSWVIFFLWASSRSASSEAPRMVDSRFAHRCRLCDIHCCHHTGRLFSCECSLYDLAHSPQMEPRVRG